jgi:hypothetical protein
MISSEVLKKYIIVSGMADAAADEMFKLHSSTREYAEAKGKAFALRQVAIFLLEDNNQ